MGVIARWLFVAGAATLCTLAMVRWAWVPHRNSIEITELTRRTDGARQTGDDFARTVRARNNIRDLARLRETAPADVRVPVLMAVNHQLLGQVENALRSYDDALRLEARPEIYVERGDTLLAAGRLDDAVSSYALAVRFDPVYIHQVASADLHERIRQRASSGPGR